MTAGCGRWPYFGPTTTLNTAACCVPLTSISTGQRRNKQVAGAAVDLYGSDVHHRQAASADASVACRSLEAQEAGGERHTRCFKDLGLRLLPSR
jgi:hypothetical protein